MAEEKIDLGVITDSQELTDLQIERIQEHSPGWTPAAGNLDTWILEGGGFMGSEVAVLATIVDSEIWRYYGANIVKLLPIDPTYATSTITFHAPDVDGHTFDAGTAIEIDGYGFTTAVEAIIPAGQDHVAGIAVTAVESGALYSDLLGDIVEIQSVLGFEATAALDAPTAGGFDGEDETAYADRLARETELFAPRPLSALDVENFARRTPGVDRVGVIDNLKPGPPYDADPEDDARPLCFTVVPLDAAGQPAAAGAALLASLQAARGTNWRIFLIDPTYNSIDVNFEAVCSPNAVPADVQATALQAVRDYLDPANWGQPREGEQRRFVISDKLRYAELYTLLNNIEGLDYVTLLEFNLHGVALTSNVDVNLVGLAPMTQAGDITGTVTAP